MPTNRAVVYEGPGQVEVHDIDYPTYELKDGPGVNKANIGRKVRLETPDQGRDFANRGRKPVHLPITGQKLPHMPTL